MASLQIAFFRRELRCIFDVRGRGKNCISNGNNAPEKGTQAAILDFFFFSGEYNVVRIGIKHMLDFEACLPEKFNCTETLNENEFETKIHESSHWPLIYHF